MTSTRYTTWAFCLLTACGGKDEAVSKAATAPDASVASDAAAVSGKPGETSAPTSAAPYRVSNRNLVQWKRYAAVEADLARALELTPDQLCKELGDKSCIREVHLVPLGGNEPYVSGMMRPSTEPLATTAPVVDRVLLSACAQRAKLDAEGSPKVFGALRFDAPLPAAGDPAIEKTVRELYHRLLARDPAAHELSAVASLAEPEGGESLSARDFASLACFTIGSTTEFLFF